MKKHGFTQIVLALSLLGGILYRGTASESPRFPAEDNWIERIRPHHPRMIFTSDDLPALRQRAQTICSEEFQKLQKTVDALPEIPVMKYSEAHITRTPDGEVKPAWPSTYTYRMFENDFACQANQAALLYLITDEKRYARKSLAYLRTSLKILELSEKLQRWVDWQANFRINMILAYDWIYNALTPEERREILLPILDYLSKSRSGGAFTFRRTTGGVQSGNYGEDSMLLFAGLAAYGDGIDDARAEEMLRFGVKQYVDMLNYRETLSAGSGLLVSSTVTYSFGPYPYATFFFFHLWRSAFGEDVADRWPQMCDYPRWFDFAAIDINPAGRYLFHGIGDLMHMDNRQSADSMYTHLAQVIHFYGASRPEQMPAVRAIIRRLPEKIRKFSALYPFLPFALTHFNPAELAVPEKTPPKSPRYFYNPGFGLLLMRSGTDKTDTYAAFRFGGSRSTHQHYDELSFVIYKNGFLALDAGTRCSTAQHHLFAAQTVAHNSILIHQPEEPIAPFWKPWGFQSDGKTVYSHGGQSRIGGAKALALQSTDDFLYAAGDATGSYAATKSREVIRQFVYLKPDLFVLFDRVESQKPEQKKEILFHAQNRPVQRSGNCWRFDQGGVLYLHTLLPETPTIHLEGGPGREFWASGCNWLPEGGDHWDRKYRLTGKWRLEVSDAGPAQTRSEFLHVLKAGAGPDAPDVSPELNTTAETAQVRLTDDHGTRWELTFRRNGVPGLHIKQIRPDGTVAFDGDLPNTVESQPPPPAAVKKYSPSSDKQARQGH